MTTYTSVLFDDDVAMIHCLRAAPRWHAYPTPQIIRSVKLSHHEANATSATGCDGQGASPSEETRCRSDKKLEQGQIVKRRSVSPAAWRRVCLGNREEEVVNVLRVVALACLSVDITPAT